MSEETGDNEDDEHAAEIRQLVQGIKHLSEGFSALNERVTDLEETEREPLAESDVTDRGYY